MRESRTTTGQTLILVERAADVVAAQKLLAGQEQDRLKMVALSPEAEYVLEKARLPFALADDYYSEDEITRAGMSNYERVDEFCAFADAWLEQHSDTVKRFGLKPARFNVYPLKILFDAVSLRLFILKRILTKERPVEVWATQQEQDDPLDPFLFFRASIFARLLPSVCAGLGLPFRTWEVGDIRYPDVGSTVVVDIVNPGWSRNPFTAAFRAYWPPIRDLGRGVYLSLWRRTATSRPDLLVMDLNDREIRLVSASLLERGVCRLLYWSRRSRWMASLNPFRVVRLKEQAGLGECLRSLRQDAERLWPELLKDPGFRHFLLWEGLDALPAVESRLCHVFTDLLVKAAEINLQARAIFAQGHVKAVVMSQVALYWQRAVSAAAHASGVRVVNMQHGMEGERLCPIVYYTECEGVDDLLTYGKGMEDFCRRHYPDAAVPQPAGSPALDQLQALAGGRKPNRMLKRLGLARGKKIVVYCPTSSMGNKSYITYSYPKSDSRYFSIQRRIVETFKDYPSLQFVVKQHVGMPREFPLVDLLRDLKLDHCRVVVEEPSFVELLDVADLVILDSPTTTSLETLASGKPVLVFNNWFQWEPDSLELFKQSVVYSDDLEAFIGILRSFLSSGRFDEARRDGSAYLRRFGTYLGDGRSAERAAAAIEKIALGSMQAAGSVGRA